MASGDIKNGRLTTGESVEDYIRRKAKDKYVEDCLSITGQAIHLVGFPDEQEPAGAERGGHGPTKRK